MARVPKIRIRQKDKQLIRRLNNNANAKTRYYRNNYGTETGFKTRGIKSFSTRKEFNKYIKSLNQYSEQKINVDTRVNGYEIPRGEYSRLNRLEKQANKNRATVYNRYKDITLRAGGREIPGKPTVEISQIFNKGDLENFKPLNFRNRKIRDQQDINYIINYYERTADPRQFNQKLNQMKTNFRDSLVHGFLTNLGTDENPSYNLDEDYRVKAVIQAIDEMSFDEWYRIYLSESRFDFAFAYSEEDREHNLQLIISTLDRFGYDTVVA